MQERRIIFTKELTTYYCSNKLIDDFDEIDEPITKIAILDPSGDIKNNAGDITSIYLVGYRLLHLVMNGWILKEMV